MDNFIDSFKYYLRKNDISFKETESAISFDHNNKYFLLIKDLDKTLYYRLMLPRIIDVTDENKQLLQELALELTTKYRVAKIVKWENELSISYEFVLYSSDASASQTFFSRTLAILSMILDEFQKLYSEKSVSSLEEQGKVTCQ